MPGEIPQSPALAEATPDSLTELFSRDPEGYSRQDRDRIIEKEREQRARVEAGEKAEGGGRKRKDAPTPTPISTKTADEMGL